MSDSAIHIPLILEESMKSGSVTGKLIFVKSFKDVLEATKFFRDSKVEVDFSQDIHLLVDRF